MRYLFLTATEAEDLQRQDFMSDVALKRRPNYEDVSEATVKYKFCAEESLDKGKVDYSPKKCRSVKHLWTQPDGNSCGACAINNVTQTGIIKNLCKAWLNQDEIGRSLNEGGFHTKQYMPHQLKFAHEKGNLSPAIGLVMNLGKLHWVALRKCEEGGWFLLDSCGASSCKHFMSIEAAIEDLKPTWPVIVVSRHELPHINQKEMRAFLSDQR